MKGEVWMTGEEKQHVSRRFIYIAFGLLVLSATSALGYEIETHYGLSEKSAGCSVLANDAFMDELGLFPLDAPDTVSDIPDPDIIKPHTLKKLIGWGAKFEDEDERPLNHFFDPLNGKPLNPRPYPCPPGRICRTSPDCLLEDDAPPDRRNAVYAMGETIDGTDRVFLIQLLRDYRGVWKVEGV
jgi:hypothetical protein